MRKLSVTYHRAAEWQQSGTCEVQCLQKDHLATTVYRQERWDHRSQASIQERLHTTVRLPRCCCRSRRYLHKSNSQVTRLAHDMSVRKIPILAPFRHRILPSGRKMKFAMLLPSGRGSSFTYVFERSGVILTHEVEAGKDVMIHRGDVHLNERSGSGWAILRHGNW